MKALDWVLGRNLENVYGSSLPTAGICLHKWTNWEQYIASGTIVQRHPFAKKMLPFTEERQRRFCTKCNKKQDEKVY